MDKELIKRNLENAFDRFKTAISLHADINLKRADGGWSVGEIGDHILKGTSLDLGRTQKTNRPYDQHAASIRDLFLNFDIKFPSAPPLQPDARQYSAKELFTELDLNQKKVMDMISNDDLTETFADIQLPGWGALTKYEWLMLFETHIIRHTKQVDDFNKQP